MKIYRLGLFGAFLAFATFSGCGYEKFKAPEATAAPNTASPPGGPTINKDPGVAQPSPGPIASPSPMPSVGTYTLVNKNILQPKCVGCHGSGSYPNFTNFGSFAHTNQIVNPGNPLISSLYTTVLSNSMPRGRAALTSQEKQLIYTWIQAGALNN